MTPERVAALVAIWARLYTRGLPDPVARRRLDELDADLQDHVAHARSRGTAERRIARDVASRALRGVLADLSWRRAQRPRTVGSRAALRVGLPTAVLLLIPLVAMQFSHDVAWTAFDFAVAGVLIGGSGLVLDLAVRKARDNLYRAAVAVALAAAFMLVWLVGAVGVIGEDGDPADLMYGGVLAVGVAGALLARFRPAGMARALLATAAAQTVVALIALLAGEHEAPGTSVAELLGLTALFAGLFLASALLFRVSSTKLRP